MTEASDTLVEEVQARFDDLTILEYEFDNVEIELARKANALNAPLYKRRAEVIAKIPHFWALVFGRAPPEVETYIQPSDEKAFALYLDTFEVIHFEIDDPKGSPRSFSLKFGFKENEYFKDKVLEKKFWFRKTSDWEGLVSEPVKIHWKKGQDMTFGLTDAAYALAQAKKRLPPGNTDKSKERALPEYKALADKIEESEESSASFFALFGFVSSWRYVSAEESGKIRQTEAENLAKVKRGELVEEPDSDEDNENDEDDDHDYQETEVFPGGDEVAILIAEDMWPSAIKYYKRNHDDDDSDDDDMDDVSVNDRANENDDDSDEELDIRALVNKGRKEPTSNSPPMPPPARKKQRKA
ncbi:hypothetical protein BDV95DRAFT_521978 [Massariosphaeria phaeospora]|uniref:Nucleosome assembly protein n=1 Tax=Massariosphaeria phaeospora TaxID=100035 RepID=A0A7C8IDE7_9PLEO|nr:hypothetical protein BDV95DRAFT_521978 [Massariosphaeria phaeospora]